MLSLEQLLHYNGHIGSKTCHQQMGAFIFGKTTNFLIFDLRISLLFLRRSISLLRTLNLNVARRQVIFLGCNQFAVDSLLKQSSKFFQFNSKLKFGSSVILPYFLLDSWIRGGFTNFKKIRRFLRYVKIILVFAKRYSEDRLKFRAGLRKQRPIVRLRCPSSLRKRWKILLGGHFSGFDSIEYFPTLAINFKLSNKVWLNLECSRVELPLISVIDAAVDPRGVSYPIPGNENSLLFLHLLLFLFINNIKISIFSFFCKFFLLIFSEIKSYFAITALKKMPQNSSVNPQLHLTSFFPISHALLSFFPLFSLKFKNQFSALFFLQLKRLFLFSISGFLSYYCSFIEVYKYPRVRHATLWFCILRKFLILKKLQFMYYFFLGSFLKLTFVVHRIFTKVTSLFKIRNKSLLFSYKRYSFSSLATRDIANFSKVGRVFSNFTLNFTKNLITGLPRRLRLSLSQQKFFFKLKISQRVNYSSLFKTKFRFASRKLSLQQLIIFPFTRFNKRLVRSHIFRSLSSTFQIVVNWKILKRRTTKFSLPVLRYKFIKFFKLRRFFIPKMFRKYIFFSRQEKKKLRFIQPIKRKRYLKIPFFRTFSFKSNFRKYRHRRLFKQQWKLTKNTFLLARYLFKNGQTFFFHSLRNLRRRRSLCDLPLILGELASYTFSKNGQFKFRGTLKKKYQNHNLKYEYFLWFRNFVKQSRALAIEQRAQIKEEHRKNREAELLSKRRTRWKRLEDAIAEITNSELFKKTVAKDQAEREAAEAAARAEADAAIPFETRVQMIESMGEASLRRLRADFVKLQLFLSGGLKPITKSDNLQLNLEALSQARLDFEAYLPKLKEIFKEDNKDDALILDEIKSFFLETSPYKPLLNQFQSNWAARNSFSFKRLHNILRIKAKTSSKLVFHRVKQSKKAKYLSSEFRPNFSFALLNYNQLCSFNLIKHKILLDMILKTRKLNFYNQKFKFLNRKRIWSLNRLNLRRNFFLYRVKKKKFTQGFFKHRFLECILPKKQSKFAGPFVKLLRIITLFLILKKINY